MNLQKAIDIIKDSEGFRDKAYQDGGGVWTLGYGTVIYPNGMKVKEGDTCTQTEAEYWLSNHVEDTSKRVLDLCFPQIANENEHCALVSLAYNIGIGHFRDSTVLRLIHAEDYTAAAEAFLMWDKINGVESKGLKARREREKALFLS